jgi:hypothetical protein
LSRKGLSGVPWLQRYFEPDLRAGSPELVEEILAGEAYAGARAPE